MKDLFLNNNKGSALLGIIAVTMFIVIALAAYQVSVQQKIQLYSRLLLEEEAYRGAFAAVNDTYFWYDSVSSQWNVSGKWAQGFDLSTIGQRGLVTVELWANSPTPPDPNIMVIKSSCDVNGVIRTIERTVEAVRDDFREYYTQKWEVTNKPVTQGITTPGAVVYTQTLPESSLMFYITEYGMGAQSWYTYEE
ncbi:MAG: hypothetical protein PHQ52_03310 [Candidatus Omnitrophica bacterium]|nr:hypothetical protein [Candidatus Omnitrophota bacterium]